MLKIKCDINQQYLKTVDLHIFKSEYFLLTWSFGSRQRDTTSSGSKFKLNNLAVKGINLLEFLINDLSHMTLYKFDKSIYIFRYEEAVGHRLRGNCPKRVNQYDSHVGFCVDKHIILNIIAIKIYSIFHGSKNNIFSFNNKIIMAMAIFCRGGGGRLTSRSPYLICGDKKRNYIFWSCFWTCSALKHV